MNKENFQIGDWFLADGKEKQFVYTDWSPIDFGYSIDRHEPIPITADILERNGFKKDGYTNLSPDYYLETKEYCVQVNLHRTPDKRDFLSVYSNKNPNPEVISYGCRGTAEWYVHELQQLLRICGLLELANSIKI